MKKTYIQPAMMLVKTEAEMMICVSKQGSTEETSGNLSKRRRGIFDDEPESSNGIW